MLQRVASMVQQGLKVGYGPRTFRVPHLLIEGSQPRKEPLCPRSVVLVERFAKSGFEHNFVASLKPYQSSLFTALLEQVQRDFHTIWIVLEGGEIGCCHALREEVPGFSG